MDQTPEIWPPPPTNQVSSVPKPSETRWFGILSLCLSVAGAICLVVGSSAPSTNGLSGKAFEQAFQANEEVMFWPVFGFLLALAGLSIGLVCWRTWFGKTAAVIALLSVAWFFRHE